MLRTKKILRDSVREYRGISLRAPVYVTLESIMECVIPFLMAMLIDYGIDGNNGAATWATSGRWASSSSAARW